MKGLKFFSSKVFLKITPKLITALISILVVPGIIFGASRGYSHFQVKHIVSEAKILSASGKYDEAIAVLSLTDNKWTLRSLREEVALELGKNRVLGAKTQIEAEEAESETPVESPTPTLIPSLTPNQQTTKLQTKTPTPVSTPAQTPTSQSTPQTILQPEVYIIENQQIQQGQPTSQPTQDYRAACELDLQRLLAEYKATEQRYEQYLKDVTQPIIDAQAAEFTRRGIPLSSGIYEQAVANAIAPYVERNRLDKEAALRQIEYQINYLSEVNPNCKDLI